MSTLSSTYLQQVIASSIDGIIVLDRETIVLVWNSQAAAFTGVASSVALGHPIADILPGFELHMQSQDALKHALNGLKSFIPSDQNVCGAGICETHYIPITENGETTGILLVMHDVAHRVKTENELKELNRSLAAKNRELKRRNAALGAFSHLTGHEFKDPMRKIYTMIELLVQEEEAKFSDHARKYFRQIQASVQRIGLLADDILSISNQGSLKNKLVDIDLNVLFSDVAKKLQEQIAAIGASIYCDPLPVYRGHPAMLFQLFQHLLDNALKFQVPGKQPVITISSETMDGRELVHRDVNPEASYLVLHFSDNGIGFEKKHAATIFRMFSKLNRNSYPGSGTGLAFCKKIVELHGGFITTASVPGEGSSFHCYLEEQA